LASAAVSAPARLLPRWEEALLAHKDRTRVLPDEYRREVIAVNGDVRQAILVDGFVAGYWEHSGERVTIHGFAPIPRSARRQLDEEARRLASWLR
jgi:Winged helix DNA-binding domain